MEKTEIYLHEVKLLGIKIRTNNQNELNYELAKIFPTVQRYFNGQIAQKIPNRVRHGSTYCVYTEYKSDYRGDYSFFIGEEVSTFSQVPKGFETHAIPEQNYVKFSASGNMPALALNAWHAIWLMPEKKLGGKRSYLSDFEIYEESSLYKREISLDIYVGIEKMGKDRS